MIFQRKCEAIVNTDEQLGQTIDDGIRQQLMNWIAADSSLFPEDDLAVDVAVYDEQVIFIEFNSMDDELDTYGIAAGLSAYANQAMLCIVNQIIGLEKVNPLGRT